MEMKRLCCFIAAIRKNEALFCCFKQSLLLGHLLSPPTPTPLPFSTLPVPHRVANTCAILFICISIFSFLPRARKRRDANRPQVELRSRPHPHPHPRARSGMRQFPRPSPALKNICTGRSLGPELAMSSRFSYPSRISESFGCTQNDFGISISSSGITCVLTAYLMWIKSSRKINFISSNNGNDFDALTIWQVMLGVNFNFYWGGENIRITKHSRTSNYIVLQQNLINSFYSYLKSTRLNWCLPSS